MNNAQEQIAFEAETDRILEILSKEIYDSPYALLRENVQNAYDAILMRCFQYKEPIADRSIQVTMDPHSVKIIDDGIGMNEEVLKHNFWKAGSSGKKSDLARMAGVIGTFGIGAMANFGICTSLRVETRPVGSDTTFISTAIRNNLKIGHKCISLERILDSRPPGTTILAQLDPDIQFVPAQGRAYLDPFIRFLPVRVLIDNLLRSQHSLDDHFDSQLRGSSVISEQSISDDRYKAHLEVRLSQAGTVIARLTNISLEGVGISGELFLVQQGGQLMAFRNYFGLAPVPVSSLYQFGGIANLDILQPTAGREALSRESIDHINHLIQLIEGAISHVLADTDAADRNSCFHQYIQANGPIELARRVTIEVRPDDIAVPLEGVREFSKGRRVYYYAGRDQSLIQTFTSGNSCLLHLSRENPRRSLQNKYIKTILKVEEVPDQARVTKVYPVPELSIEEVALLLGVTTTLAEDYLLSNAQVRFANITHGVAILVQGDKNNLKISLARDSSIVRPVLECHRTAYNVFSAFVKDFVRVHLYQRIRQFVPSSTSEGADALRELLLRNRELYRYEESEFGPIDPLISDLLSGQRTFEEVIKRKSFKMRKYTQTVSSSQVGSIEEQFLDIESSPAPSEEEAEEQFGVAGPILRTDVSSSMKVLVAADDYQQLNKFRLFLGLSDRLFNRDGAFFLSPHSTKIIWGSHRIIYIFTHASGEVTMYYDIELKEPLHEQKAGGGVFPTTTMFTKNRIYVPVPTELVDAFRVTVGAKEFFVRFDLL